MHLPNHKPSVSGRGYKQTYALFTVSYSLAVGEERLHLVIAEIFGSQQSWLKIYSALSMGTCTCIGVI